MSFRSVITWSIAISLLILIYMSIYPGFASDAELLNDVMAEFPEEFLMAFGMDGIDLSTVLGFFGITLLFSQICVAIQAANYGFALVSVEERELTADFLLSKPVGRTKILTSKLLAALTSLAITNMVIWISSFGFINIFRDGRPYETKTLVLLLLTTVILPNCRYTDLFVNEKDKECDAAIHGACIRAVCNQRFWRNDRR